MLFEGTGNNPGDKTLEDKFFEHEVGYLFICAHLVYFISLPLPIHEF